MGTGSCLCCLHPCLCRLHPCLACGRFTQCCSEPARVQEGFGDPGGAVMLSQDKAPVERGCGTARRAFTTAVHSPSSLSPVFLQVTAT